MRILVSVASRHGATQEIGDRIADVLRKDLDGATVIAERPENLTEVSGFDAYVIGSAVYMGRVVQEQRVRAVSDAISS